MTSVNKAMHRETNIFFYIKSKTSKDIPVTGRGNL
jgi:hypothetical protein